MNRAAIVCAILEDPETTQEQFNTIVSDHQNMVLGRMGIPITEYDMAAISITVSGTMDEINSFTGKLGALPNVQVKTAISKKEVH